MKRAIAIFLFLTGFQLVFAQAPLSESINNIPTALSLNGSESYVVVQGGIGKKAATSLVSGVLQPFDDDLSALAALTGTNTIYYRSAANIWTPVTIGANITFAGGTLSATGGSGDITAVGNVASGGAFDGTAGTIFTFDDADGDMTIKTNPTANTLEISSPVDLGPTGVRISTDGDGAIIYQSISTGNQESFTINMDDTSNEIVYSSTTGANFWRFSGISMIAPTYYTTAVDPADSGAIRLGTGETIGWEASPAGTDVTVGVNATEAFVFSSAISVTGDGAFTGNLTGANLSGTNTGDQTGATTSFADTDNNWTATNVQAALEELDNVINTGLPNASDGKVDWSQITNVPAGFADGADDAGAGGADATAIHDDTANEIVSITDKTTPVAADHLLIEDSAAANAKKDITIGSLETALEGVIDLPDLQGNVTDAQVPDAITITLASTATTLVTPRLIGNVSFNGSADIVPQTSQVVDSTDTTSFVALFDSATGNLQPKTDAGVTYNAGTGAITASNLSGTNTGDVILSGTPDYITISGQNITRGLIDLSNDVSADLPFSNLTQGSALSVLGVTGNATADHASIAAGSDNQVLRRSGTSLAFGLITDASLSGAVGVAKGGTGLTAGTSGGIPYFSGSTTIASSGALTANALILGGGTGASPTSLGSLGTSSTVLHGNASGSPAFGPVSLTSDVSGFLPAANLAEGTPATGQVPVYQSDGSVDWSAITATSAGSANWIQYAGASGSFAAEAGFEYNPGTDTFTVSTISTTNLNVTTLNVNVPIAFADNVRQTFNPGATTPGINVGSYTGDPSTPSNGDLWYDSNGQLFRARINGANVSLGAGGGATAWSSIGNAAGNASISLAGFTSAWTSTLDSAGAFVWDITNTDADSAAATGFIQLKHNDGADSDVVYMKMVGDADGTPVNDFVMSQTSFAVGSGIAVTHGGVAVPTISSTSTFTNKNLADATNTLPAIQPIACSDMTTAITATGDKAYWKPPFAITVTDVVVSAFTAPTGAAIIVDIEEGGVSILGANRLQIDATETSSRTAVNQPTISDSAIASDALVTIDFDQVGSTIAGAGIIVQIIYTY